MLVSYHFVRYMPSIPLHKAPTRVVPPARKRPSTHKKPPSIPHSVDLLIVSPTFVPRPEFDNLRVSFQDSEPEIDPELSVRITIFFHSI